MALFDFLKPKWTAERMTDDDRRRLFWSLKRSTSYSAWLRCRQRYSVFVDLMERQCREEPLGRMPPRRLAEKIAGVEELIAEGVLLPSDRNGMEDHYVTKWTAQDYAEAMRGLALYDKGLARLKQGDRSVFLHNSQGALEDAYFCADRAYQIYYLGGPKGGDGMEFHGKYVAAMMAALKWAVDNGHFAAGGLQRSMADLSSAVWTETRYIQPSSGPRELLLGTRDELMRDTAHLKEPLPNVPEPTTDDLVYTGQPCPAFGIYEPLVKDGVMTYMCQGERALRYGEPQHAPGAGIKVLWRLLWKDDRYVDGRIPDEEVNYYPEPVRPPDFSPLFGTEPIFNNPFAAPDHASASDPSLRCEPGQPCPREGFWFTPADANSRRRFGSGERMPAVGGNYGTAIWQWDDDQTP